jgi:hypothetical protein
MALNWNAGQIVNQLEREAWERLVRTAEYFTQKLQEAVNTPNTGVRVRRKRDTVAGPRGSSYTIYPDPAIAPEAPHKRTGWGQRNIAQFRDRGSMTIKVGERQNAAYMIWLQLRGYDWLLATLSRERGNLQAIVQTKTS